MGRFRFRILDASGQPVTYSRLRRAAAGATVEFLLHVKQDNERLAHSHDRIEESHMDPEATWKDLLEARLERDWDRAEELAENLLEWMNKKGFPPNTVGDAAIGRTWHHAVAQFVCFMTINDVKTARKRLKRKRP